MKTILMVIASLLTTNFAFAHGPEGHAPDTRPVVVTCEDQSKCKKAEVEKAAAAIVAKVAEKDEKKKSWAGGTLKSIEESANGKEFVLKYEDKSKSKDEQTLHVWVTLNGGKLNGSNYSGK